MRIRNVLLTTCFVLAFATASRGQGVNDAELKGDYAFSFTGMTTGGSGASTPFAAVGRFTADGIGNLVNGELDSNGLGVGLGGVEKAAALAFTGNYSIGADNRGVMTLIIPGGGTLAFAMMSNGNAKFVEIDASGGHGTVGSGSIEKVDTSAYNTARIAGDYAFGVAGQDQSNNRTAIAGRFTANGAGILSNGAADENFAGRFTTMNLFAGTYMVTDSATGRGIMNIPPVIGGSLSNLDFVFYVVNGGKLFAMDMDAVSPAAPLLVGTVLQQQTPVGGFSNASLNGTMVIYLTGLSGGNAACAGGGLLKTDGMAGLTLTYDQNCNSFSAAGAPGTYSVASNGRAAIRPLAEYVAAYLVNSNEAFLIAPDGAVSLGFGEPQAAAPLTNSSVIGKYAGSATTPTSLGVVDFSGEFSADGVSPTGNLSGTEDIGAPSGATLGAAANATYSISSSPLNPTNGRGTISGSFSGVLLVISPSKFVVVQPGAAASSNAAILIFEQ